MAPEVVTLGHAELLKNLSNAVKFFLSLDTGLGEQVAACTFSRVGQMRQRMAQKKVNHMLELAPMFVFGKSIKLSM
ncbi:MAG: hypothetical protein R2778_12710 [Saprospiraceae bacterium]